jgi:hypothetical protein
MEGNEMEGNKVAPGRITGAVERTGPKTVFLEKHHRRVLQGTEHETNAQDRRSSDITCTPFDVVPACALGWVVQGGRICARLKRAFD